MADKKKKLNPEERLQARVGLEINRRLMREHSKAQAEAVAVAKWESTMGQRDALAQKKRDDLKLEEDMALRENIVNEIREKRLIELYDQDEKRYQDELKKKGLVFRRMK
eukprot:TRINITY_DN82916_c0_g1_i1.p1 TRINITY_DN82916_c0_g1~~TRINITY_DN82916_c0_g1_i1.p1  ORF type:complete len:109 (+),score=10.30 TRINITY_DN82916_c0_g1_i1:15-341(+)